MFADISANPSELVERFGAFGVLVILIGLTVWKGLPWIAARQREYEKRLDDLRDKSEKRLDEMHASFNLLMEERGKRHDEQIKIIMQTHEKVSEKLVESLDSLSTQIQNMNARLDHIEANCNPHRI